VGSIESMEVQRRQLYGHVEGQQWNGWYIYRHDIGYIYIIYSTYSSIHIHTEYRSEHHDIWISLDMGDRLPGMGQF
jgi:hypothetical protein